MARLLVVRGSGHLSDGQRRYPRWELPNSELQDLLAAGVGGVILLGGSAAELRLRTEQLSSWASHPLLLCADVEEGVGQRFEGGTWLVPPLALGRLFASAPEQALLLAGRYGRCTARQARALGLNWLLAPVCDVNNNPANPVINVRAWGEDPATVGAWPLPSWRRRRRKGCSAAPSTSPATATRWLIRTWRCRCSPTTASDWRRFSCRPSAPPSPLVWAR